jgi:hypothetical protein
MHAHPPPHPPRSRAHRLAAAALLALGAACGAGAAPDLPCATTADCPARTICGPEATCILATACAADADCCPGADCFNGYCRPTHRCSDSAPCLTPGEACEAAVCVASPCGSHAACPDALRCIAGRCTEPLPCGGCPDGAACHAASGRCLAAPLCTAPCAPGSVPVVDPAAAISPTACGPLAIRCACTPLAALPPPLPGLEGTLLPTPDGPTLISHDPTYGDLVASRFSPDLSSRLDTAVDGVPALAEPSSPPTGYRSGIAAPGPRRGLHPAAIWRLESGHPVADLLHQDGDTARTRYARVNLDTGAITASHELPLEGASGRYSCIARHPATGRVTAYVYVDADPSMSVSRLVHLDAQSDAPTAPTDWTQALIHESPLPATAPSPCGGACALTELCVRFAPSDDRCVGILDRPTCAAPCAAREVCVAAPTPACRPRVFPAGATPSQPTGQGPFVTCAAVPDGLIAAWYDADAGALRALRGLGPGAVPMLVDGTADPLDASDVGAHARLAVSPTGPVRIAYQDARAGALRVATQESPDAAWQIEVVHTPADADGGTDLGAWPTLVHLADGTPLVAYADTDRGDIWVARRTADGCWTKTRPLSDGAFAWPSLALSPQATLHLTALTLLFDDAGRPLHQLVITELPAPSAPCGPSP